MCNKWLILFSAHTTPPILRLKSGKSASSSNSASQVRRKHQIQILELSGFSIKSCRQQTLIGRHSGKNMGKGASSSSSERVIATSVSTFPKGKSNTCPAGRLPKRILKKTFCYLIFTSSKSSDSRLFDQWNEKSFLLNDIIGCFYQTIGNYQDLICKPAKLLSCFSSKRSQF